MHSVGRNDEFSQNKSESGTPGEGRSIGGNRHQPKSGSQARCRAIRRGEGGGRGVGRALMVARAGDVIAFLQAVSQGNRTRATIKALPAAPPRPRPYGILDRRLRLMRMSADQSAVGAKAFRTEEEGNMAVSTKEPETSEQRPPGSKLALWTRKIRSALGPPVISVILAMIAGAIVILITWPDKTVDPFTNVINAYTSLFSGSFGSLASISDTLVRVTPLLFVSLSVAIAFRAGFFNIGTAGQLAVGAMAADMIGLTFTSWPAWILVPTMLLASMLAGALWGGIAGFLKAGRGAHEVFTTIMLNWIAFYGTDYLINSPPFTAPNGVTQTISLPPNATLPFIATLYNQTLGNFLPQLDTFTYTIDVGLFLVLIPLLFYWFIISLPTFAYAL